MERARFYGGYLLAKGFEDLPLMRKTRVEQSLGFETSMSAIASLRKTILVTIVFSRLPGPPMNGSQKGPRTRFLSFIFRSRKALWNRNRLLAGHRGSRYRVCQDGDRGSCSMVWTVLLDLRSALVRFPTAQA